MVGWHQLKLYNAKLLDAYPQHPKVTKEMAAWLTGAMAQCVRCILAHSGITKLHNECIPTLNIQDHQYHLKDYLIHPYDGPD